MVVMAVDMEDTVDTDKEEWERKCVLYDYRLHCLIYLHNAIISARECL